MLSSAADYKFVTGITNDEVLINGEIMPVRDVEQGSGISAPKCLRGEDICYLYEAVSRAQLNDGQQKMSYSNQIRKLPFLNVISKMTGWLQTNYMTYPEKLSSFNLSTVVSPTQSSARDRINTVYGAYFTANDVNRSIVAATSLSADNVRQMYYDLAKIKSVLTMPNIADGTHYPTLTLSVQHNPPYSGVIPKLDTDPLMIIGEAYIGSSDKIIAVRYDNDAGNIVLDVASYYHSCVDIREYGTCDSAVLELYTTSYSSQYTSPNVSTFRTISATLDGSGKLIVPLSVVHGHAQEYFTQQHISNQFYTSGRSDWPRRGSGNLLIKAHITPIVRFPDIDFSDIGWNWTPS